MAQNKPKQDARWERTRQRLIDGGRRAFAERGVEGATVLDIVRAAGVSQPSFYNHFESKDALAREIAAEFFRTDRQTKQAVFEQTADPAEAIAINVADTLSIATTDPVIAWTLIKSSALRSAVIAGTNDPLEKMIKAGNAAGRFQVPCTRSAVLAIRGGAIAVIQGMLNKTVDNNADKNFQELVLRMLGLDADEAATVAARVRQAGEQGSQLESAQNN